MFDRVNRDGLLVEVRLTMITSQVENEEACSSDQLGWDHAIKSMAFGAKARCVCCGQDGFQRSHLSDDRLARAMRADDFTE